LLQRLLVDARCSAILAHRLPRCLQDIGQCQFVVERVEAAMGVALRGLRVPSGRGFDWSSVILSLGGLVSRTLTGRSSFRRMSDCRAFPRAGFCCPVPC
jgi:hypothetical protein